MPEVNNEVTESLRRLEPSKDINGSIIKLLLLKAKRELVKYTLMDRNFQRKYETSFQEFSKSEKMKNPDFEIEQDYFDWELAMTGIEEMKAEITKLKELAADA